MNCQKCNSNRIIEVQGKCSDRFVMWDKDNREHVGYVPKDIGIGGGDYVEFKFCLECGQIQGTFPVPDSSYFDEEEK